MTLDQIRALCDAATPGPWETDGRVVLPSAWVVDGKVKGDRPFLVGTHRFVEDATNPDTAFIAAARDLVPKLLEVAEAAVRIRRGIDAAGHVLKGSAYDRMLAEALAALEASP